MKDWNGNANSIYKTLGASNHTDKEREENDYYATDPIAIDKLLEVETPSHYIWEPAAGEGHLVTRLKEKGFAVLATDIIERNFRLDYRANFLEVTGGGVHTGCRHCYKPTIQVCKRICASRIGFNRQRAQGVYVPKTYIFGGKNAIQAIV